MTESIDIAEIKNRLDATSGCLARLDGRLDAGLRDANTILGNEVNSLDGRLDDEVNRVDARIDKLADEGASLDDEDARLERRIDGIESAIKHVSRMAQKARESEDLIRAAKLAVEYMGDLGLSPGDAGWEALAACSDAVARSRAD